MQREKHSSQKAHKSRTALRMDWCLHSSHIFAEGWENERVKGEWGNENRNKQGNQDLQLKCCHLISTILFALLRSTFFLCVLCIFVICYIFFVCVFFLKHTHTHTFFYLTAANVVHQVPPHQRPAPPVPHLRCMHNMAGLRLTLLLRPFSPNTMPPAQHHTSVRSAITEFGDSLWLSRKRFQSGQRVRRQKMLPRRVRA